MSVQFFMRAYNTVTLQYVNWVVNDTPDTLGTFAPGGPSNLTNISVNRTAQSKVSNFIKPGDPSFISPNYTNPNDGYLLHLNSYDWLKPTTPGLPTALPPSQPIGLAVVRGSSDGAHLNPYAAIFWQEGTQQWVSAFINANGSVGSLLPISTSGASPSGAASGDLSGNYPGPTVAKINATTVSTAGGALTTGQVLRVTGASSIDYGAINLANSSAVTGALPITNQVNQSLGGDLSGTTASGTVIKLQGNAVQSGVLGSTQDGYVLTWVNGSSQWQAKPDTENGPAGGDLFGNYPNPTAVAIQGNTVTAGALTEGQFLVAQSTSSWAATTLSGDISESNTTPGKLTVNTISGPSGSVAVATAVTNKFVTNLGRRRNVVSVTTSCTVADGYDIVSVGTISAGITVTLPPSPTMGDTYDIKDAAGTGATKNITVSGNGNNIDGSSTFVINTNYGSVTVAFNNVIWIAI